MSDDKVITLSFTAALIVIVCGFAKGCQTVEQNKTSRENAVQAAQTAAQAERAKAPTVVTCVEHSVLDRVQVVQ